MSIRVKRVAYIIGGLVVLLLALWAGYTQLYEGSLGQPDYTVLETYGEVEFRQYEPFLIASTRPSAEGRPGLNNGFRTLAEYIFGGNQPGESIDMTAPVLQQNESGESLPMTAPVLQEQDEEGMRMAFVMPAGRTLEDLPVPNNESVELTEVDWGEVAAIRFSGRGKQERFVTAESELREALVRQGRQPSGPALYAQYNSPSAFPPLRRNEVLIPLQPESASTR